MVSHLLLPMHVTKAHGQTVILLVRVVKEESGIYPSIFDNIFCQQYWFFVSHGRNTPGFLYKCVPYTLFIQLITHTFKWMHFLITSAKQQHYMVFAAFLLTHSHSSLCELGPTASVKNYCVVGTYPSYFLNIFNLWQHHA